LWGELDVDVVVTVDCLKLLEKDNILLHSSLENNIFCKTMFCIIIKIYLK